MLRIETRVLRTAAVAACVAALSVIVWVALDRLNRRAGWVAVEAPAYAVEGQPLPLRITVKKVNVPTYLVVNLHWSDRSRSSGGYLSSAGRRLLLEPGTYTFAPRVIPRQGLGFVTAVVYLSSTGDWEGNERSAWSDLIRVRDEPGPAGSERLAALPVYDAGPRAPRRAGAPVAAESDRSRGTAAVAALLLASSLLAAWTARRALRPERRAWAAMAVALAAAAVWELSGAGRQLTQLGRLLAASHHWYYMRKPFQAAVVAALSGIGAGLAVLIALSRRALAGELRLALLGATLYGLVSAVDLLSFHATDAIAGVSVAGFPLIQVLKAGSVAAVLAAAARRPLRERFSDPAR